MHLDEWGKIRAIYLFGKAWLYLRKTRSTNSEIVNKSYIFWYSVNTITNQIITIIIIIIIIINSFQFWVRKMVNKKRTVLLDIFMEENQSFEKHCFISKIKKPRFSLKNHNILDNSGKRITPVFGTRVLISS